MKEYGSSRKDGIAAIILRKDELISVEKTSGKDDILLITRNGQAIRFSEEDCGPMGRATQGVIGMRLQKGDEVLAMAVIKDLNSDLFIITENGFGKEPQYQSFLKFIEAAKVLNQ